MVYTSTALPAEKLVRVITCLLCSSFNEEQLSKIVNRKCYIKKFRKSDTSLDETEILGEQGEIFLGSREEYEESALHFYNSLPHPSNIAQTGTPKLQGVESLFSQSPKKPVPPTPGTDLQQNERKVSHISNVA